MTEIIPESSDPNFEKVITVTFAFGQVQKLKFEIVDDDGEGSTTSLGYSFMNLAEIVSHKDQIIEQDLEQNGDTTGQIIIKASTANSSSEAVKIVCQWNDIDNKQGCLCFKEAQRVYMKIERRRSLEQQDWKFLQNQQLVQKVNQVDGVTSSPKFEFPTTSPIFLEQLCNNKLDVKIGLSVHFEAGGEIIDQVDISAQEILNNPLKVLTQNNRQLQFLRFDIYKEKTFMDHMKSGWQINFSSCIDFSRVNKIKELHKLNQDGSSNAYQESLFSIASTLEVYSMTRGYPLYGFGGFPVGSQKISNCFTLNGDIDPEVQGLQELNRVYKKAVTEIRMKDDQIIFAEVLSKLNQNISQSIQQGRNQVYHVILILTAGPPNDMQNTKKEIGKLAQLPVSIIIVGIGEANFDTMTQLMHQPRQMVQFFKAGSQMCDKSLKNIPDQICEYMKVTQKPDHTLVNFLQNLNESTNEINASQEEFKQPLL